MKGIQKRTRYAPDVHAEIMRRPQSNHNLLVNLGLREIFGIIELDALLDEFEKAPEVVCLVEQSLLTSFGREVDEKAVRWLLRRYSRFTRA